MDIYQAMADEKRRRIIERLNTYHAAKHGLSIKELTAGLGVSRQAITKHLNHLIKCGAITAQFTGKEKKHFINQDAFQPAIEWLTPIATCWDERLVNLKHHLRKEDKL